MSKCLQDAVGCEDCRYAPLCQYVNDIDDDLEEIKSYPAYYANTYVSHPDDPF